MAKKKTTQTKTKTHETKYQKEEIVWQDHCGLYGKTWYSLEEIEATLVPSTVVTLGYVLYETKEFVVLAMNVADDGSDDTGTSFGKPQLILKTDILSRKVFK